MRKKILSLLGACVVNCAVVVAGETRITELDLQIVRSETAFYETSKAEIVFANDEKTLLNFENFLGSGARIVATLDADGNVAITPQPCGSDDEGNYLMIVNDKSINGQPFDISNTQLKGKFDGATLTLEPWNLMIVPYTFAENLGAYFPESVTSTFVKSNGKMEYAVVGGEPIEVPVYAEENDDEAVDVYGWGKWAMVTIRQENGFWAIDSAAKACYSGHSWYNVVSLDGTDLNVSIPDARTAVCGAWQLKNAGSDKVSVESSSANLTFNFDLTVFSGLDNAVSKANIISSSYFSISGMESTVPCPGFNIRVDVFSDGTVKTSKIIGK